MHEAAENSDYFIRKGSQPFCKNDPSAPGYVFLLQHAEFLGHPVKVDEVFAKLFVEKISDRVAQKTAQYRAGRADRGIAKAFPAVGNAHGNQQHIGRYGKDGTFDKRNPCEAPDGMPVSSDAERPVI